MSLVQTERVLVVPTDVFRQAGYFQGFTREVDRYLDDLFSPQHTSYRPRSEVEGDPNFKQLIPYVIFQFVDPHEGPQVFQYTRGTGQGEQRLHRKRSVGIGGHISIVDADGSDDLHPYQEGMWRELREEVSIETEFSDRCVGLINDDDTPVGRVHLGVVHLFDVEHPRITPNEPDIVDAGFRPVADLLADLDGFETWSQHCLRALFGQT